MNRISDALELLTAQHDEIERLLVELAAAGPDSHLLLGTLADKITTHLAAEAQVFYPTVAALAPVAEHDAIKAVLAKLLLFPLDALERERSVTQLATLMQLHVAREDELFRAIGSLMPEAALCEIGDELAAWSAASLCLAA